jgi:hypothetical protein
MKQRHLEELIVTKLVNKFPTTVFTRVRNQTPEEDENSACQVFGSFILRSYCNQQSGLDAIH